jgi:hypothetical protein
MFGSKPVSNRKTMDASLSPLGREKRKRKKRNRKKKGKEMIVVEMCIEDRVPLHGLRIGQTEVAERAGINCTGLLHGTRGTLI